MPEKEWLRYRTVFENELRNILEYWITHSVDPQNGGFYGAVDLDGHPVLTANKSAVLNTRILWTFSAAAQRYGNEEYGDMARRAFREVTERFADKEYGGFFMELAPDNRVASDIKHTYAQAFALYSLCKYYEYKPESAVLEEILGLFRLLEEKTHDPEYPGYGESFTRDWQPLTENRMADNNEPRSMNTHLHVLEAYAALYKIRKDALVKKRLHELLTLFLDKIIRANGHLGIFFDRAFEETASSAAICFFGHDIEASWLLCEAAEVLGDKQIIRRVKDRAVIMAGAVEREGVDKDGGLFLESYRYGSHVRTNKHWWLQAETLVGFMNAWQLTGEEKYRNTVKLSWDFIDRYVIDHERGEWYTKVNRLGVPFLTEPEDDPSPYYRNDRKIDPWKCPYHNGRAMLEMIQRIDKHLKHAS